MENHKNSATSYIQTLLEHDLYYFTAQVFADQFHLPKPKAYQTLHRLKGAGLIREVEQGKYLTLGLQPARVLANPLFIATQIARPAYVSFWSALHFYGLTEQAPRTVFIATTRKKARVDFEGYAFQYVHVKPAKFFGYRRERVGDLSFLVAEKEKALVDALDQPRYAGGIAEIAKCLANARDDLDQAKLIEYANRVGNRSLASRLGYLLTQLGLAGNGLVASQSFVRLDPHRKPSKTWDARWRLNVNVPAKELTAWRES